MKCRCCDIVDAVICIDGVPLCSGCAIHRESERPFRECKNPTGPDRSTGLLQVIPCTFERYKPWTS